MLGDFFIEAEGSDDEWCRMLQSFESESIGVGMRSREDFVANVAVVEPSTTRKRARDETCSGTKSKACREKVRRDRLNGRFLELSSVLDPDRPPKADKASILSDASCLLIQLKAEAQELKESNEKLKETITDLKVEKNELRDEKMKLKADKERLEQEIKIMTSVPPSGFLPHPIAFHPVAPVPAASYSSCLQARVNKAAPYPTFPGMVMWPWLPPKVMDTSQDTQLWPPNA